MRSCCSIVSSSVYCSILSCIGCERVDMMGVFQTLNTISLRIRNQCTAQLCTLYMYCTVYSVHLTFEIRFLLKFWSTTLCNSYQFDLICMRRALFSIEFILMTPIYNAHKATTTSTTTWNWCYNSAKKNTVTYNHKPMFFNIEHGTTISTLTTTAIFAMNISFALNLNILLSHRCHISILPMRCTTKYVKFSCFSDRNHGETEHETQTLNFVKIVNALSRSTL